MTAAAARTSSKLRVLCLHGYTSNSQVHAHQLRRLTSALSSDYEFLFPDGPHKVDLSSSSPTSAMDMSKPANQVWHELVQGLSPRSAEIGHRAWWFARDPEWKTKRQGRFEGLEETFEYLGRWLREHGGPVDAVWGFSQGGCLAGMVVALLQKSQRGHVLRRKLGVDDDSDDDGSTEVKAGVVFAGFRARFEVYDDVYEPYGIETPVLHVMGNQDPLVDSERGEALMRVCKREQVLRFEGGHDIPKGEREVERIVAFMRRYVDAGRGREKSGKEQASM